MEEGKKFDVEFKQTAKGSWYVGSVKVGADSVEELDKVLDSTVTFLHTKIDKMNKGDFKPGTPLSPAPIELNYGDGKLFEKLRSLRMDLSRAENLPPYVVAHDSVLKRLAKVKPMTKEEMIEIEGIGERNFDKYGVYFLKVIRSSGIGAENGR
ncbi:HRDC domain-containing protein [Candidatus Woesearchaeota archaeon]|nr:HRDC domain-containing protein [Candidatus Woesearchaeota archaeon]